MVQVGFRCPETLVSRLDALVERENEAHPGRTISRADLVRGFLIAGVDLAESKQKSARKSRGT